MAMGTESMPAEPTLLPDPAPVAAAPAAGPARLAGVLVPALSGVLLMLCFPPFDLGWLAWVALVPLLTLVRSEHRPRTVYLAAGLAGLAFYVPALQWMRVADPRMVFAWLLLALYCSLYFPVALALVRRLDRRTRLPLVVTAPAVWVGLEYVRSVFATGFAWYFLGHAQHDFLPIVQVADLGGVYAVSLLVAAVNALACDAVCQAAAVRRALRLTGPDPVRRLCSLDYFNREVFAGWAFRRNLLLEGAAVALLLGAAVGYGLYRLGQDRFEAGPLVSLLQGNLPQKVRNDAFVGGKSAHQLLEEEYRHLCAQVLRQERRPALIVWPETSYPEPWVQAAPELPIQDVPWNWREHEAEARRHVRATAGRCPPSAHLLGVNAHYLTPEKKYVQYNSALLVTADGNVDGRFDKLHRVPFGEYVPLLDWLPFMKALSPYDFDYGIAPGATFPRLPLGAYRFGVLICFEDTDPALARQYVRDDGGGPVDFLVNPSNDGWFAGSSEHETHLALCRFRAVECRRAVARAVNMGISAVIDGNGRVLRPSLRTGAGETPIWAALPGAGPVAALPPDEWGGFKAVAGVLTAEIPLDRRASVYAALGDWLPAGLWLVVAAGLVVPLVRRGTPA